MTEKNITLQILCPNHKCSCVDRKFLEKITIPTELPVPMGIPFLKGKEHKETGALIRLVTCPCCKTEMFIDLKEYLDD